MTRWHEGNEHQLIIPLLSPCQLLLSRAWAKKLFANDIISDGFKGYMLNHFVIFGFVIYEVRMLQSSTCVYLWRSHNSFYSDQRGHVSDSDLHLDHIAVSNPNRLSAFVFKILRYRRKDQYLEIYPQKINLPIAESRVCFQISFVFCISAKLFKVDLTISSLKRKTKSLGKRAGVWCASICSWFLS